MADGSLKLGKLTTVRLQGYMVHVNLWSISGTNQQFRWPP